MRGGKSKIQASVRFLIALHYSVLKRESVEAMMTNPDGCYVDLTGGYGGHSEEIVTRLGAKGRLIIFDQDAEAYQQLQKKFSNLSSQVTVIHENFMYLKRELARIGIKSVNGVLMDLGMSTMQLQSERGFSFQTESPLDMRMDSRNLLTAQNIVNEFSETDIIHILKDYGEELAAKKIARRIVTYRKGSQIQTTLELVRLIEEVVPKRGKIHPATKSFQALRIAVNHELECLKAVLEQGLDCLLSGGRWVVISFHSLEDRIVKETFWDWNQSCICPKQIPYCVCHRKSKARLVWKGVQRPSDKEVLENPASRSAKMRAIEKI